MWLLAVVGAYARDWLTLQLIAEGSSKFASIPSGGAGGAASGGAAPAAAAGGAAADAPAAEEKKEAEKEESDDDMVSLWSSSDTLGNGGPRKAQGTSLLIRLGLRSVRLSYSTSIRVGFQVGLRLKQILGIGGCVTISFTHASTFFPSSFGLFLQSLSSIYGDLTSITDRSDLSIQCIHARLIKPERKRV